MSHSPLRRAFREKIPNLEMTRSWPRPPSTIVLDRKDLALKLYDPSPLLMWKVREKGLDFLDSRSVVPFRTSDHEPLKKPLTEGLKNSGRRIPTGNSPADGHDSGEPVSKPCFGSLNRDYFLGRGTFPGFGVNEMIHRRSCTEPLSAAA